MDILRKLLGAALLGIAALIAAQAAGTALARIVRSFRTSSSPGVGAYDAVAGLFLGGYYDDIAADCAVALDTEEASGGSAQAVLEIGPGPGHLAERLLTLVPSLRWTGLDVDPAMLTATRGRLARAGLRERAAFVEGDVAALPFADGSFDLVVSSLSAHHWPDAEAGFREIRRVLRSGGAALVYDLPAAWGRAETGSRGIGAALAAFDEPRVSRFRGMGPLTIVSRVELRRPA